MRRMMSDLFKRQHGDARHSIVNSILWSRPTAPACRPIAGSRWRPTGCMRDSMSRNHATGKVPPADQPTADPGDQSARSSSAPAALRRHTRMVVTVRELDDLLRRRCAPGTRTAAPRPAGVCHRYQRSLSQQSAVRHRLVTIRQMAGYACWYNLQQDFLSWLAAMGWQVILHTGVTTRSDLLQRFLQLAANHFRQPRYSWRFVWHWSPQAGDVCAPGRLAAAARVLHRPPPQPQLGIWHRFAPSDPGNDPLFHSPLLAEADFLACQADAKRTAGSGPGRTAAAWPPANITRCTAAADPAPCASVSSTCRRGFASVEYADRRYAGYQRPLFSRRAADG